MSPTLEERVAALEEASAHPPAFIAREIGDEETARLEQDLREALGDDSGRHHMKILPAARLLTPELAAALVRECVTVVRPGEVLAISIPDTWSPADASRASSRIQDWADANAPGLKILFVPEGEHAVVQPDPDDQDFRAKLDKHLPKAYEKLGLRLTAARRTQAGRIPDDSRSH